MKKIIISKNTVLLIILMTTILVMGIGYASIESVTGEIRGKAVGSVQSGVFITNVEYVSDIDAEESKIEYYTGTMMKSTVKLSSSTVASEIKYKVSIFNNSDESVPFNGVVYDNDFYDNSDIVFNISGFEIGQIIEPNETKEIVITFRYKDNIETVSENNVLRSYLNFKMSEPNRMIVANSGDSTTNYLKGTVAKNQIESIKFERGKEPTDIDIISRFDASAKQDESIIGYYTDEDNNGLYELTFVSEEVIYANKNAAYLFGSLNQVKSIEFNNFSTYGVTNMHAILTCKTISELDLSCFDTSKVVDMGSMFSGNNEMTKVNISSFDTSNVTNMSYMFNGCNKLIQLDVSNFNTSQVIAMEYMFNECTNLENIEVNKFDTQQVTSMRYMFCKCWKVSKLDLSSFKTSNVKNMQNMFSECRILYDLDLKSFDTSSVISMENMFYGCQNLASVNISGFNTQNVVKMNNMFNGCKKLTELDVSGFNTSNVTDMASMFQDCTSLKQLNVSGFNTSNVTDMASMFQDCTSLKQLNVSEFDTSKVTRIQYMFSNCNNIEELDVSKFETTLADNFAEMFKNCKNIKVLDLSNFNTNNVTNMLTMFNGCNKLQTIYVSKYDKEKKSGWTTAKVDNSTNMFLSCIKITGGNGTTYNAENIDATYARIDTEETPGYFTNIEEKVADVTQ